MSAVAGLEALFSSGAICAVMAALLLVEAGVLALWLRARDRAGRPVAPDWPLRLVGAIVPGLCLVAALYIALAGLPIGMLALALTASLFAHLMDLWARFR
ncbi:MAG: hypothetical protein AAFO79_06470 [Pseudomonadota bacterium]